MPSRSYVTTRESMGWVLMRAETTFAARCGARGDIDEWPG
jgi:hypothetical protein